MGSRRISPALATAALAGILATVAPPAWAGDDGANTAPRTAVTIGGASVVLIATTDKLYAFVDRIEDNAPIEDATLSIENADGGAVAMARAPITLNEATAGLFVGPLNRTGQLHGSFAVTLHSAAGDGTAQAEIAYADVTPDATVSAEATIAGHASKIAIALVSGGIGAVAAVLAMLWLRSGRRRVAAASVSSAQTV